MVNFKGGIKEAAKMLAGLAPNQRARVLAEIAQKDANMAEALEHAMVTFEDLSKLSIKQLQELLRDIKIADIALGLRAASEELKTYLYKNLPKSLCQELDDVLLGPPRSLEQVLEAQDKVAQVLRQKIDQGKVVLAGDDDPFV